MDEPIGTRRWRRVLIIASLVGVTWVLLRALFAQETLIPVGTPIRHDDFSFTVLGSRDDAAASQPTKLRRIVVTLEVKNQAKRVTYQFRPECAVLIDGTGHHYRPVAPSVGSPGPLSTPLAPGTTGSTDLVYEVPGDADHLRMIVGYDPVGTVIEDLFGGRVRHLLK